MCFDRFSAVKLILREMCFMFVVVVFRSNLYLLFVTYLTCVRFGLVKSPAAESSRMRIDTLCVVTNFSEHGISVKRST